MWDFSIITNIGVPKDAVVTPNAMMPKVLCCIEGQGAKLYVDRKMLRKFIFSSNALKKHGKLLEQEQKKAMSILGKLSGNKPLYITRGLRNG